MKRRRSKLAEAIARAGDAGSPWRALAGTSCSRSSIIVVRSRRTCDRWAPPCRRCTDRAATSRGLDQSALNAAIGSTFNARRAGMTQASKQTPSMTTA